MKIELVDTVEVGNTLGEGVIWDLRSEKVWWTDIQKSRLYYYHLASKKLGYFNTPQRLCSFGFTNHEDWIIVAFEKGFAKYNPGDEKIEWLSQPQKSRNDIRFNDGRVDRQGRFWAGTMVEGDDAGMEQGTLYQLDLDKGAVPILDGISISNSLCWSPSGEKMYFADSPNNRIDVYDFEQISGMPSNRKTFASTETEIFPDGSTIDAEGYLWNAQWGGSRVVRYSPEGEVDHILELQVSQPTCVAFGGPDLTWLIVTTAKDGLSDDQLNKQPLAGSLFIYKTEIKGLPEHFINTRNDNEKSNS